MRDIRPYSHFYPMTLAETASTFGEKILTEGIMQNNTISDEEKTLMLDTEINHGAIYLMDIPVRFEFEKAFYEERQKGEVSVSRLKELMTMTQQKIFGDILEENGEDPYFWASKLHFYITGVTFYNFPYTFGYLLSRGLFAMFKQEGKDFLPKYEKFLRLTGSDTAENVARKSIGEDLESPEFWAQSIRTLKEPLEDLRKLLQ
jgi:oligoendopeptidase F